MQQGGDRGGKSTPQGSCGGPRPRRRGPCSLLREGRRVPVPVGVRSGQAGQTPGWKEPQGPSGRRTHVRACYPSVAAAKREIKCDNIPPSRGQEGRLLRKTEQTDRKDPQQPVRVLGASNTC